MLEIIRVSAHRLARPLMFAGIAMMFLPFGILVGLGKGIKLLSALRDAI